MWACWYLCYPFDDRAITQHGASKRGNVDRIFFNDIHTNVYAFCSHVSTRHDSFRQLADLLARLFLRGFTTYIPTNCSYIHVVSCCTSTQHCATWLFSRWLTTYTYGCCYIHLVSSCTSTHIVLHDCSRDGWQCTPMVVAQFMSYLVVQALTLYVFDTNMLHDCRRVDDFSVDMIPP